MDDEESLRELGLEILDSLGYQTMVRTNANEALQAFRTVPQGFDLVISDQNMLHMTGEALAEEIPRIRSRLLIILLTGFNYPVTSEKFRG